MTPTRDDDVRAVILRPCTIRQAASFVAAHHRHSEPPRGGRFAIAGLCGEPADIVGVVIVANPISRHYMDGATAEITRCCVAPAAPRNTSSRLMRAAWRAWAAMGGVRMVTYTLTAESGASLRGAGFRLIGGCRKNNPWNVPNRPRRARAIEHLEKQRWELTA